MNGRGRVAIVALVVLVIFLLASALSEFDKRKAADAKRDKALMELSDSYDKVSEKVAEYLIKLDEAKAAAEAAGREVTTTREQLLESLKDTLPQEVIDKAVEIANRQGKQGAQGPPGPPGPPGQAAAEGTTTTSTAPAATTTTTRPRASTTSTTTTTRPTAPRPCSVEATLPLGLGKVCL